jgi:hypothetical protein
LLSLIDFLFNFILQHWVDWKFGFIIFYDFFSMGLFQSHDLSCGFDRLNQVVSVYFFGSFFNWTYIFNFTLQQLKFFFNLVFFFNLGYLIIGLRNFFQFVSVELSRSHEFSFFLFQLSTLNLLEIKLHNFFFLWSYLGFIIQIMSLTS